MIRSVFLIVSLLVFCSSDCLASGFDEPTLIPYGTVWPEKPETEEDVQTEVTDDMAERSRRWLIDHLDNLSGGIDSFFVDRFFNDDVTDIQGHGSHAKFSFFTRRELGDPVDVSRAAVDILGRPWMTGSQIILDGGLLLQS